MPQSLFVPPPRTVYDDRAGGSNEYFGATSYATYNYLGGGLIGTIKTRHFEVALRLARSLEASTFLVLAHESGSNPFDRIIPLYGTDRHTTPHRIEPHG